MATEIERKFLVINDLWREHVIISSELKQAYLSTGNNATVRVRVADDRAFLTVKSATVGISRAEYEYGIPVADATAMLQLRQSGAVIEKTRYRVKCGNHVWDLDIFRGENRGLQVAEVELESEDEQFQLPEWVGAEVSGDHRYQNSNLIDHPYSAW
ncbi:MAG: CYTH domain-containing protein [Gammaproteobacteria bacterium]|nr:CYTH domain-containing protein [Gammaproteobacteria bacterium]